MKCVDCSDVIPTPTPDPFRCPVCRGDGASYYGNLARVAMRFHVANGNPAELDAAFVYAKLAAHHARATGA